MEVKEMPSPMSGKDTLDKIIKYCQSKKIMTMKAHASSLEKCRPFYNEDVVKIGNFVFDAHSHSTGCSLRVWVLADDCDALEIISTTYWYHQRYTFNDSKREHGAWDKALGECIERLKILVNEHKEEALKQQAEAEYKIANAEEERKSKFEALFAG